MKCNTPIKSWRKGKKFAVKAYDKDKPNKLSARYRACEDLW